MSLTGTRGIQARVRAEWAGLPDDLRSCAEVLAQSAKDFSIDNGQQWAAALAYYAVLSVFPLLLMTAFVASFFVDPQWAVDHLSRALNDFVPQEGALRDIVTNALHSRGQIGVLAFGGFLITGTRAVATLSKALSITFHADEDPNFWRRLGRELLMLLTIGIYFILAMAAGFLMGPIWDAVKFLPARTPILVGLAQGLIQGALLVSAFFLIYRYVPRAHQDSRAALIGALVATVLVLTVSPLFQYYISRVGTYNIVYGSLALAVILLIWTWLLAMITLFGGEVASHTKELAFDHKAPQQVERAHERRAPTRQPD